MVERYKGLGFELWGMWSLFVWNTKYFSNVDLNDEEEEKLTNCNTIHFSFSQHWQRIATLCVCVYAGTCINKLLRWKVCISRNCVTHIVRKIRGWHKKCQMYYSIKGHFKNFWQPVTLEGQKSTAYCPVWLDCATTLSMDSYFLK